MGTKGTISLPDDGDDPDLAAIWLETVTSFYTRVNNYAATTSAANTLAAAMTSGEKLGTRQWVDDRKGWRTWDGSRWLWEPQNNLLAEGTRSFGPAVTGAGSPQAIILTPTVTLPPGNRRVRIVAATLAGNANGGGGAITQARAYISGTNMLGLADANTWLQAAPIGGAFDATVSNTWEFTVSGTCKWDMYGVGVGASDNVIFKASRIVITDLGPTDS